jgi:biopolymer transport protein ExbD
MIRFRRRGRTEESINPTPMVDVMFNLLIFVIVTAQYTNVQVLKVNLPKAQTGVAIEKAEKVIITVGKAGEMLLNGQVTDPARLEVSLKPLGQKEPQPAVLIQADEASATGMLVTAMDLASKAGLKKISIETKK